MKFLLKICVFMAIILISKFTTETPANVSTPQDIPQPDAAFVHYWPQADTTTAKQDPKQEVYPKAYN